MIETVRRMDADLDAVWRVLSDGRLYGSWVVGASRVRAVEGEWPAVGSKIHHSVGAWPLLLNDETVSVRCEPRRRLVLQARGRPFGQATVEMLIERSDHGCQVRMLEDITSGPAVVIPAHLRRLSLVPRNRESLRRLDDLARLSP